MQKQITFPEDQRKISTQLRAVLRIFTADPYLEEMVWPHINFETESIFWNRIFKIPFGSGHRAAVTFAYSVWTDEVRPKANPFSAPLSMGVNLQQACLDALAMRWGIHSRLAMVDNNSYNEGGTI